jgi:hypothetical protein
MTGGGSFEEFHTGTVGRLLGYLFLVTGDLHEAEEVVQRRSPGRRCAGHRCATTTPPKPGCVGWQ